MAIWLSRRIANLKPSNSVINILATEELNKYSPQPISRTFLVLNARLDKIPLMNPIQTKITANIRVNINIIGWSERGIFGKIW